MESFPFQLLIEIILTYYKTTSVGNGRIFMMKKIVVDSKIHFGKLCLSGTRIPVQNVLELIEEGISFNDIVREYYPQLTIEDIKTLC